MATMVMDGMVGTTAATTRTRRGTTRATAAAVGGKLGDDDFPQVRALTRERADAGRQMFEGRCSSDIGTECELSGDGCLKRASESESASCVMAGV